MGAIIEFITGRDAWREPWARPLALALVSCFLLLSFMKMPDPLATRGDYSTVILSRDGSLMGASIAVDGQWRFPPDTKPPEKYVTALVAYEDRRFYSHAGFDPGAFLRALYLNLSSGEIKSGGSTLSMQAVSVLRGAKARNLGEKALEALFAIRLEASFAKEDILRIYAARAPFGGNVVGLEAASWRYFGRPPSELSWAEAATLAVLPNAPALMHPGRNRDALKLKRDALLAQLLREGSIDEITYEGAIFEPLPDEPKALPSLVPHLLERAKKESVSEARVRTSLDADLQARVAEIARDYNGQYASSGVSNVACLVVKVDTGEVLAYVGNSAAGLAESATSGSAASNSAPSNSAPYVDIVTSVRSTGSILKPFLYAAQLEAGELLPDQLVVDIPTRIGGYIPENNSLSFSGVTPASEALARSLNVPAVRNLRSYGVDRFYKLLKDIGMTSLFRPAQDYGLTLILGGAEASLWDIVGMYGGLARTAKAKGDKELARAFFPPSYRYQEESESGGPSGGSRGANPYSQGSAFLTMEALMKATRPGAEVAWQDYASSKKIAWKTGTSYGNRDAWCIGLTPEYVVGIWVGNASGEARPSLKGFGAAAPVMFNIFSLLPRSAWFSTPDDSLVSVEVCAKSGYLAGPDCQDTKIAIVPLAGKSASACPYCRVVHLDSSGKWQVTTESESILTIVNIKRFVLPPAIEWYYMKSHFDYRPPPPYKPGYVVPSGSQAISLIVPEEGSLLYIPIELDGSPGRAVFQAAASDPHAVLFWHLDGEYVGETEGYHQLELKPSEGQHTLTLIDERGEMVQRHFTVLSK